MLTERDYELLSTYLDGALNPTERSAFEQRLQREPGLQTELESLRATVALLGQVERLPVPRNFTLDPAAYRRKPGLLDRLNLTRLMPFVAVGAMAAIALIVVAGVVLVNQTSNLAASVPQGDAAMAPAGESAEIPAEEAEEAEVQMEAAAAPTEEPLAAGEAGLPEGGMGGGGSAGGEGSGPSDTGVPGGVGGGPPGAYPPVSATPTPLPMPTAAGEPRIAAPGEEADEATQKSFAQGEAPVEEPGEGAAQESAPAVETAEARGREGAARTLTLVVILGGIGAVIAGIGLALVVLARRRR